MQIDNKKLEERDKPLWTPSQERIDNSRLSAFVKFLEEVDFENYHDLWQWSNTNTEKFWSALWDFVGVIGKKGDVVLKDAHKMPGAQFFPNGTLNYAENLLRKKGMDTAIIFRNERGEETRFTFDDVHAKVSFFQQLFIEQGVKKGDRVAAYMPNCAETIFAACAAASLGAVFSSASPDFGAQGLIDRFGQIDPIILVTVEAYYYNGKTHDCLDKVKQLLPHLPSLKQVIIIPFTKGNPDSSILGTDKAVVFDEAIKTLDVKDVEFTQVEFNHPLYIMFSSGTTGVPKCIVHGHGGTLLQHLKEWVLQCDIHAGEPVFYFTTCGWMMWNWLISALACEAPLLLYDGSPFYPDGKTLWEFTSKHKCRLFGTSAKYIDALKNANIRPDRGFDLSDLKILTSTGSPLVHESFDYIYEHIKSDLHVASIYGGTDIISASFGIGNPCSPVWRGELQGAALATPVDIYDAEGNSIPEGGGAGELVCTGPIPSMPVSFWNDEDGQKYFKAYFAEYPNIWRHGDWVEKTEHHGLIVHGRSDATLNPGGVRIGTSEIYRQVEQIEGILESLAIGQDWEGDVRVVLFVRLEEGLILSDEIEKDIRTKVRIGASPRHVPAKIIQVADIPRTKSNKIVELAVRDLVHGRPVKNVEALANPDSLELYEDLLELKS